MESKLIGKQIIARIERAGVFFGTLEAKDSEITRMTDVRRIYYWSGALSVTDMSRNGIADGTVSAPAKSVEFETSSVIELNECAEEAVKSITSVKPWKMNS